MPPIPCAHCGVNYMRHSLDPEAPKLCNNCTNTIQQKPKEKIPVTDIKVIIMMPSKIQAEIEEICINMGVDFSEYFLSLHRLSVKVKEKFPHSLTAENMQAANESSIVDSDGLIDLPKTNKKKGK